MFSNQSGMYTAKQHCRLGYVVGQRYREGFRASQGHYSGSVVMCDRCQGSTVGKVDGLAPCLSEAIAGGSETAQVLWLGFLNGWE